MRAVMAGRDGERLAAMGEGRINNKAVDLVGADLLTEVFTSLNPLATKDDYTRLTCAVVRMAIRNGVATADKGIAVETKKMNVIGSGTVNLKTEKLDLAGRPRPKEGLGISLGGLPGLVRITGPLPDPPGGAGDMVVVCASAAAVFRGCAVQRVWSETGVGRRAFRGHMIGHPRSNGGDVESVGLFDDP